MSDIDGLGIDLSELSPDPWGETLEHLAERAKTCIESGDPLFVVDARFVLSLVATAKAAEARVAAVREAIADLYESGSDPAVLRVIVTALASPTVRDLIDSIAAKALADGWAEAIADLTEDGII